MVPRNRYSDVASQGARAERKCKGAPERDTVYLESSETNKKRLLFAFTD